jgi:hypothetical protein
MAHLVGMPVTFTGLTGRPELNGATATVVSWHADRGRYGVNRDGTGMMLKPENLRFIPRTDGLEVKLARIHGEFLESRRQYEAAAASYELMLPFAELNGGDAVASTLSNIGLAYKRAFKWSAALKVYYASLEHCASQRRRDCTYGLMAKMIFQLAYLEIDSPAGYGPEDMELISRSHELWPRVMRAMFYPHYLPYVQENGIDDIGWRPGYDYVTSKSRKLDQRDLFVVLHRPGERPEAVWVYNPSDGEGVRGLSRTEIENISTDSTLIKACLLQSMDEAVHPEDAFLEHGLRNVNCKATADQFAESMKTLGLA